jgi:hypothetical protein
MGSLDVRRQEEVATVWRRLNMRANPGDGEDRSMSDEPENLEEVQRRLDEIQQRKRGRIRWNVSRHTAEIAIEAITGPKPKGKSGKARRRKRKKKLL